MRLLDLFSGIGGFSLGLERAGMTTVAFCEIEPYCQAVLKKHWPGVPVYDDVRTLTRERLRADGITDIDVVCGGFPCQDISGAGKQAGIDGERSGLWAEFARLIGDIRPRYAIVENVAALLSGDGGRWFGRVLGDLAEIGYDAEWHCIPASAVGAPHRRDRVWVVAHATRERCGEAGRDSERCAQRLAGGGTLLADTLRAGLSDGGQTGVETCAHEGAGGEALAEPKRRGGAWWAIEPGMGRMADGVPDRAHRLNGLGNAVVPQIPEIIGRALMAATAGASDARA